jgi:filamentous hemagglutinin
MGGGSASFSAQNGHADGNYAGVNEQAGIQAGSGGFDVTVKGNTDLKGAYIGSTADAAKNTLTTGSLTYSDIENHSHYAADSNGFSAGVGVGVTGKAIGPGSVSGSGGVTPMISQSDSGDENATTRSGVSAGTINITNAASQTQDVANLSRDTSNLNGAVSKTPDVQNLLDKQADTMNAAQAAGQVVSQGIGAYADMKRDAALSTAKDATAAAKAAMQAGDTDTAEAYAATASQALSDAKSWSEGGDSRALMQTAGGALIGGLGGGSVFSTVGARPVRACHRSSHRRLRPSAIRLPEQPARRWSVMWRVMFWRALAARWSVAHRARRWRRTSTCTTRRWIRRTRRQTRNQRAWRSR